MKKFFSEFKAFALKGNVLDLAVGVIIGGAFTGIVTSLTDNFINPIITFLTAGQVYTIDDIKVFASNFASAVVNFIILAFILFCLVKGINKMMSIGKKPEEAPAPTTKKCPYCCTEIAIEATRCPHCTSVLETEEAEAAE
ncbi:MAG: large conductance mechanosensitive channel protein MscL [Clostridia bacterium]|nr:large conductance mechanosensitive channel protein MscL [Clostridia bacterium]